MKNRTEHTNWSFLFLPSFSQYRVCTDDDCKMKALYRTSCKKILLAFSLFVISVKCFTFVSSPGPYLSCPKALHVYCSRVWALLSPPPSTHPAFSSEIRDSLMCSLLRLDPLAPTDLWGQWAAHPTYLCVWVMVVRGLRLMGKFGVLWLLACFFCFVMFFLFFLPVWRSLCMGNGLRIWHGNMSSALHSCDHSWVKYYCFF